LGEDNPKRGVILQRYGEGRKQRKGLESFEKYLKEKRGKNRS